MSCGRSRSSRSRCRARHPSCRPTWPYAVEATDGHIGKVDEASYEAGSSCVVVDTGFWIFGKRMLPAGVIERIDPEGRKLYVSLTKDDIKEAPTSTRPVAQQEAYRKELSTTTTGSRRSGGGDQPPPDGLEVPRPVAPAVAVAPPVAVAPDHCPWRPVPPPSPASGGGTGATVTGAAVVLVACGSGVRPAGRRPRTPPTPAAR